MCVYIYTGRHEKGFPYLEILDSRRPRSTRSDIPGAYKQIRTPQSGGVGEMSGESLG